MSDSVNLCSNTEPVHSVVQMVGVLDNPPGSPQAPSGVNVLEGRKVSSSDLLGSLNYMLQVFQEHCSSQTSW